MSESQRVDREGEMTRGRARERERDGREKEGVRRRERDRRREGRLREEEIGMAIEVDGWIRRERER